MVEKIFIQSDLEVSLKNEIPTAFALYGNQRDRMTDAKDISELVSYPQNFKFKLTH